MRTNVTKVVKMFENIQTWSGGKNPVVMVNINHESHMIGFEFLGGSDPTFNSIINLCCCDKDILMELRWALKQYKRTYPCFFKTYRGVSGCEDIQFFFAKVNHDWACQWKKNWVSVFKIHISMYGKVSEIPDMFAADLLELLNFTYSARNKHSLLQMFGEEGCTYASSIEIKKYKGRLQKYKNFIYLKFFKNNFDKYTPICKRVEE